MTTKNTIPTDAINYMVEHFEATGTLPTNYIECSVTGNAVTCFGSNLKKKVEQYGDIKTLLTTFVSKGAKKKTQAKTQVEKVQNTLKDQVKKMKSKSKLEVNGVDLGEVAA